MFSAYFLYKINKSNFRILLSVLCGFVIFSTLIDIFVRIKDFANKTNQTEDPVITKSKMELVGTNVVETKKQTKEMPKMLKFFVDCSIYSNTQKLFRTDNGGKITCLNGIRLFSVIWIVFGHTFNYISYSDKFFVMGIRKK